MCNTACVYVEESTRSSAAMSSAAVISSAVAGLTLSPLRHGRVNTTQTGRYVRLYRSTQSEDLLRRMAGNHRWSNTNGVRRSTARATNPASTTSTGIAAVVDIIRVIKPSSDCGVTNQSYVVDYPINHKVKAYDEMTRQQLRCLPVQKSLLKMSSKP